MLRIYFNSSWGSVQTDARSFAPKDGPVVAGTDENARLPLFGFQLPAESYPIAEWHGTSARVFPPPGAALALERRGEAPAELPGSKLSRDGERAYVLLEQGMSLHVRNGEVLLQVTVDQQRERASFEKNKALFWLVVLMIATLGGPIAFLLAGPDPTLPQRALTNARIKNGLSAEPEPLDVEAFGPPPPGQQKGVNLPASVR